MHSLLWSRNLLLVSSTEHKTLLV